MLAPPSEGFKLATGLTCLKKKDCFICILTIFSIIIIFYFKVYFLNNILLFLLNYFLNLLLIFFETNLMTFNKA